MLGFKYFKGSPNKYYLHYIGPDVKREGAGLSFFY